MWIQLQNKNILLQVGKLAILTLSLLTSYIYGVSVKPEILTSYIYGRTFGNAESRLFLLAAQCFNIESIQKIFTAVCKQFASYQGYPN
jgi:hypothetical protein